MLLDPQPQYLFDRFASKNVDQGKFQTGDKVSINRYPMLASNGLGDDDRKLSETQAIGTSYSQKQTVETVDVYLEEWSGPHDGTGVGPLVVTEKVIKQAQQKLINESDPLSFFNSIGGMSLKNDHDKWHDRKLCNLLLSTTNKYNPDGVADGSTATTSTGSKLDSDDLKAVKENLQTANIPTFPDGYYYAVISPRMEKHLKQDADFKEACYYYKPDSQFKGSLTEFEGFRFWTSTNIPTATVNSLTAYQGVVFGPNAIGYGEGRVPLQIRRNKNDDYERFLYLVWMVYRGYAMLDSRFVYKLRTFAA
jgi:N4-gp56 family major capsid protein